MRPKYLSFFLPLVAAAVLILASCATTPVATSEAKAVPAERVLSPDYLVHRPGTGLIVVKRDAGMGGASCASRVVVDGHPVADLAKGEKVLMYLWAGDHIIGASPNGNCNGGFGEATIDVRPDRTTTLRIRYSSNGDYTLQTSR